MIDLFCVLITISFLFLSVSWLLRIHSVSRWLSFWLKNKDYPQLANNDRYGNIRFFVLLPVLDEVGVFEKTVIRFSKMLQKFSGSRVVIITTEEEYSINKRGDGRDSVSASEQLSKSFGNVLTIHYPFKGGKMAHQVNYAVHFITEHFSVRQEDFFALYNSDSHPDERTFPWIRNFLTKQDIKLAPQIFQQYGDYFGNYSEIKNSNQGFFKKSILISAGLWQNRWSVGFEIPHSLQQFRKMRMKNLLFLPMNYCIGHGLFFSFESYKKLNGFSEDTHNEDAIFGLKLSYYEIPIIPIPFFDKSYSPNNLTGLFFQKASWFFGPLEAFEYYRRIVKEDPLINRTRLFVFSAKLFSHAIYWVFGPLFFLILLIFSFLLGMKTLFLLVFLEFLVIPNIISWLIVREETQKEKVSDILIFSLIGSLFFYMLHGISAWFSLFRYVRKVLFGTQIKKQKTAMINT